MGSFVAVYGTLKTGGANYERLLPGKEPEFRGFVRIPFLMFENGEYPMIVPDRARNPILVEVFDVSAETLARLDELELPYGYQRERLRLEEMGEEVAIYVHPAPPPAGFRPVPSGDWPV